VKTMADQPLAFDFSQSADLDDDEVAASSPKLDSEPVMALNADETALEIIEVPIETRQIGYWDQELLFQNEVIESSGKTIEALEYSRSKRKDIMRLFNGHLPQSIMVAERKSRESDCAAGTYDESGPYSVQPPVFCLFFRRDRCTAFYAERLIFVITRIAFVVDSLAASNANAVGASHFANFARVVLRLPMLCAVQYHFEPSEEPAPQFQFHHHASIASASPIANPGGTFSCHNW
jgi:hypothetical protein